MLFPEFAQQLRNDFGFRLVKLIRDRFSYASDVAVVDLPSQTVAGVVLPTLFS